MAYFRQLLWEAVGAEQIDSAVQWGAPVPIEMRLEASGRSLIAMKQLRAAAVLLEQSESEDAARVAAAIRLYEREAPLGRSLDDALGLTARGGAGPWWEQECRNRRDGLIRALRREFFSDLGVSSAASEIAALANARRHALVPPRNRQEAMVDAALRTGVKFPGPKRLTAMLGIPIAD